MAPDSSRLPEDEPTEADVELAILGWESCLGDVESGTFDLSRVGFCLGCLPPTVMLLDLWCEDGLSRDLQDRLDRVRARTQAAVDRHGTTLLGPLCGKVIHSAANATAESDINK